MILGNHRDAWTYGAVDPNSGTAALLDIARRYSLLMRMGWTPRRTIILCSWDAEEFGMLGNILSSLLTDLLLLLQSGRNVNLLNLNLHIVFEIQCVVFHCHDLQSCIAKQARTLSPISW